MVLCRMVLCRFVSIGQSNNNALFIALIFHFETAVLLSIGHISLWQPVRPSAGHMLPYSSLKGTFWGGVLREAKEARHRK